MSEHKEAMPRPWAVSEDDPLTIEVQGAPIAVVFGEEEFPCLEDDERPRVQAEAEETTRLIVAAVNSYDASRALIEQMRDALKRHLVREAVCPDCQTAKRHANSDATTPGFFRDKCADHQALAVAEKFLEGK